MADNITNIDEFKRLRNDANLWSMYRKYGDILRDIGGSVAPIAAAFTEEKFTNGAVREFLEIDAELEAIDKGIWEVQFLSNLTRRLRDRQRRDTDPTEPEVYAKFNGTSDPVNMSERMVGVKMVEVLAAYVQTYPGINNTYMFLPLCDALEEYANKDFVVMDYDVRYGDRRALLLTMGHRQLAQVTLTVYGNVIVEDNRILERLDREDADVDEE